MLAAAVAGALRGTAYALAFTPPEACDELDCGVQVFVSRRKWVAAVDNVGGTTCCRMHW